MEIQTLPEHTAVTLPAAFGFQGITSGIAIGLALTLIHLISIPVTNTSVNPARSTGPALFAGGWALAQLWFFWVFPILGGAVAGFFYRTSFESALLEPPISGRQTENALS